MLTQVVRRVLADFCLEFVRNPYLCRTEHSLHVRFYHMLYDVLPPEERYAEVDGKRVCTIQKEYPTGTNLGKSKRQGWDISVIRLPPSTAPGSEYPYDSLRLDSVVEFGMNEKRDHLEDDIRRLSRAGSQVDNRYLVHLYRLSNDAQGRKASGRDWSPKSSLILRKERVSDVLGDHDIELYYGMYDNTNTFEVGAWRIHNRTIAEL